MSTVVLKVLKPNGYFTYRQVQHSPILHGVHIASVLRTDFSRYSDVCLIEATALTYSFCVTEVDSVYCAVHTKSLYKTITFHL